MFQFKPLPAFERLHELLKVVEIPESQYGINSGLIWRIDRGGKARAGRVAGKLQSGQKAEGRLDWIVGIDGKSYMASRIIFYMVNGIDPKDTEIDHMDWNPLNNNEWNLRLGDDSLQGHNRGLTSSNTSGVFGVSWNKQYKKWESYLKHRGKKYSLGRFSCKIAAARARNDKVSDLELDKIGKPLNDLKSIECSCRGCLLN